jgi:hypothetical protein
VSTKNEAPQSLPMVLRMGEWPDFSVFLDGVVFRVRPTADGMTITPSSDAAWARMYAADVEASLTEWRKREKDSVIRHKLARSQSLAAEIVEAIIDFQTRRAMV